MNDAALYRAYADDGQLLYVGSTERLPGRFREHSWQKPWWGEVARITAKFYGKRWDAYKAETAAIKSENPLYNHRDQASDKRRCPICGGRFKKNDLTSAVHAKCNQ